MQNHLQTVLRGQTDILEQLARSALAPADVMPVVDQMARELRQPLTSVEAVLALTATVCEGTQGSYAPVNATEKPLISLCIPTSPSPRRK